MKMLKIVFYVYNSDRDSVLSEVGDGVEESVRENLKKHPGEILKVMILDQTDYPPHFLGLIKGLWKMDGNGHLLGLFTEIFEAGMKFRFAAEAPK